MINRKLYALLARHHAFARAQAIHFTVAGQLSVHEQICYCFFPKNASRIFDWHFLTLKNIFLALR
jgi:hypothetical protein